MKANFSFTDFMGFSENLVNTLELVAEKVDDISNKIAQIEETVGVEGTDQAAIDAVAEGEELGGDVPPTDDLSGVDLNGEAGGDESSTDMPPAPDVEASDEPAPSEFSFVVVGRRERPWGNAVVSTKEFSTNKDKYTKLIPTTFSTQAQAQRALTSYNVNGENFSIRYNNVKNILNM